MKIRKLKLLNFLYIFKLFNIYIKKLYKNNLLILNLLFIYLFIFFFSFSFIFSFLESKANPHIKFQKKVKIKSHRFPKNRDIFEMGL